MLQAILQIEFTLQCQNKDFTVSSSQRTGVKLHHLGRDLDTTTNRCGKMRGQPLPLSLTLNILNKDFQGREEA